MGKSIYFAGFSFPFAFSSHCFQLRWLKALFKMVKVQRSYFLLSPGTGDVEQFVEQTLLYITVIDKECLKTFRVL